jgi:ABC-type glycerol-3-phosphate transport system permease component
MAESPRRTRVLLAATRLWLPLTIAIAGVVLIVAGQARSGSGLNDSLAAVGVALIIAALIVWMINWMFRMSVESNREREREEAARDHYTRYGHWPDEDRE